MNCLECRYLLPWANGIDGECKLKLPPSLEKLLPPLQQRYVDRYKDGCDLGKLN